MIKALAILILCLFFSFNLSASYHCCDSPDADFINLGQKYPSVGYFSCKTGIFGSGTLVDLGPEELKGRVVITCAHIFNDEDIKDISFTVGDTPPIRGKAFQHSKYRELIKESETAEKLISPDSFDLCLFILDIPILNIPLASADLNTPTKSLVGSAYVSVGFGRTGHFFGKCLISDSNKRASYAFALHEENEQKDQEHLLTIILEDEHGTSSSREQNVIELCGSTLALTPYVKGKEVSKLTHDHQTFEKPAGIARSGDSGGGSFDAQGNLIGVISGGSGNNPYAEEEQMMFEKLYFLAYQNGLEEIFNVIKKRSEEALERGDTPEPVNFGKESIIDSDKIPDYMVAFDDLGTWSNEKICFADLRLTVLSYHKQWIEQVIAELQIQHS